jgi:hypothetical protein
MIMGLDMFLMAKRGLSSVSEPAKEEIAKAVEMPYSYRWEVGQVVCEAGYWRKVNAIHNWFVENVQKGEDECREHRVSREQLLDLLNAVDAVLETEDEDARIHKALELLPPASGFFFGSTDIGKYYFKDLEETRKILLRAVNAPECWDFYYQSSW